MGYGNDWSRISLSGGYHYTDGYRDNNYYDHNVWSLSAGLFPTDVFELTLDTGYSVDAWGNPGALFDATAPNPRQEVHQYAQRQGRGGELLRPA